MPFETAPFQVWFSLSLNSVRQGLRLRRRGSAVGEIRSDAKIGLFTDFKTVSRPNLLGSKAERRKPHPFSGSISATKQGLRRWGSRREQAMM
ncbi:hypothetical protein ES288_D10G300100v1 [Gossypium darwinii]|uniref:Uncharacterized protein n=1 Tax=Gossypium darwinii TaxID=34276 RepID=A0A5D2B8D2_GOSDA|nr:hypothetical protein ES288_D10G300100v1 [Gossypium darwinii]